MNSVLRIPNWAQGFRARMLAGFLVVSVPVALLLAVISAQQASQSLAAATQKAVANLAVGASLRLDTWLTAREADMGWVATSLEGQVGPSGNGKQRLQQLGDSLSNNFDGVQVVDPNGKVLFGVGSVDFQPGLERWFQESLKQSMVTPISIEGDSIQWSVTAPMAADATTVAAVVIGELRLSKLSGVLSDFGISSSNEIHLVDSSHKIVYSSDWGAISSDAGLINQGALRLSENNAAVVNALTGQSGALRTTDYRGDDVLSGFALVRNAGWALIASELASSALAPAGNQLKVSLLVAAIAIGLAAMAATLLAWWIARPMTELAAAASKVVAGDLSTRVAPGGAREVRLLGDRFNNMIQQLEHLVVGLRELGSKASQSAIRLSTAAEELAAATTEQTAAATQTSASMEELARTSTSIAETLQRVSVQVQETRENLEQAQADMQASGTRTLALAERVNDVNEILGIINEIADQTNLLALNAAIEAARAGETGRGFAVVADEVRRLAERSKSSAGKISKIIENARTESNATVMAMEQSTKQMQRGLKLLEDVVEASSHVQVITQQQRSATEQVLEAMEQIASGSRQVSNTAAEISKAATTHAGLSTEMETMSRNGAGSA